MSVVSPTAPRVVATVVTYNPGPELGQHLRALRAQVEEVVVVDPKAMKNEERPLFDFAGQAITHADWDEDGSLHLGFSDGHEIHAHSDERRTAWELYGKYHGYAACLPRGEVRVVRHDLAEEDED